MRMDDQMGDVQHLYTETFKEHGPTAKGVGWQDHEVQRRRLLKLIDGQQYGISSILDVGCGYGALVEELARIRSMWFNHVKYVGIDIVPEMIAVAKSRYEKRRKETMHFNTRTFHLFDVRNMASMDGRQELYDLVVCSGALSYYDMPEKMEMLDAMWALTGKVLAFNMRAVDTYIGDLTMILPRFGTSNWKVYHDYGLDDMTVVVKR
jgi:SAM-dependent methyltransferase